MGEGPRPYQFQLLVQVVGLDAGHCPNQCTMSRTRTKRKFYNNLDHLSKKEKSSPNLKHDRFNSIDQFSKLQLIVIAYSPELILTQKHTHISSHEIQAVFTLIRKHVKEKDRPREPRRGANVMPVAAAKENRPKVKELSKLSKVKVVEIKR
ncbi:hypothetical protein NC651_026531 [Populus alba x Populus x berolinensis]|nr:hypothetical protein NC651_026531 [Populus alba x Populus x berolinensis]